MGKCTGEGKEINHTSSDPVVLMLDEIMMEVILEE